MSIDSVSSNALLTRALLRSRRTTPAKIADDGWGMTEKTALKLVSWDEPPVKMETFCNFYNRLGVEPLKFAKNYSSFSKESSGGDVKIDFTKDDEKILRRAYFNNFNPLNISATNCSLNFKINIGPKNASNEARELIREVGRLVEKKYGKNNDTKDFSFDAAEKEFEDTERLGEALIDLEQGHRIKTLCGTWLDWRCEEKFQYDDIRDEHYSDFYWESTKQLGFLFTSEINSKSVYANISSKAEPPLYSNGQCYVYVNGLKIPNSREWSTLILELKKEKQADGKLLSPMHEFTKLLVNENTGTKWEDED